MQPAVQTLSTRSPQPGMTMNTPSPASRRPDRKPETDADRKLFDLRASGYTGPLDQDGNIPDPANVSPLMRRALEALGTLSDEHPTK